MSDQEVPAVTGEVPVLEYDETVPPRPEEEVADAARAEPDPRGHGDALGTHGRHARP